jgi:hypothetical protein
VVAAVGELALLEELRELATELSALTDRPERALAILAEVEARASATASEARAREVLAGRVRELEYVYADLAASESETAEQARELLSGLRRLRHRADVESAAQELAQLSQRHRAEADRRFAIEQATAVLREMGYTVDLDLDGAPGGDGAILANAFSPRWPRHGLQVVFRGDKPSLHTVPVAIGDTDRRDDVAFEESSCRAVDELRDGLTRRGLSTEVVNRTAPDVLPVRRLVAATTRRSTTTAKVARNGRR